MQIMTHVEKKSQRRTELDEFIKNIRDLIHKNPQYTLHKREPHTSGLCPQCPRSFLSFNSCRYPVHEVINLEEY